MKNKNIFLFLLFFPIILCSQSIKEEKKEKKEQYKTFENNDFVFNYPKKWRIFNEKQEDIIVSIAPKFQIADPMRIPGIMYSNKEYSICKFNVSKEKFKFNNPEEFIAYRKKTREERSINSLSIDYQEKIINNTHFQEIIIFRNPNPKEINFIETANLMHYFVKGNQLYTLQFTTRLKEIEDYKEEAQLIFSSFFFKNP